MNEKLKDFFEKLMKDEEFREKFASAKTAYDGYTKAKPYIEGISFDEFKKALTYLHNKIDYRKKLLNSDLAHINGGVEIFEELLFMLPRYDGELF